MPYEHVTAYQTLATAPKFAWERMQDWFKLCYGRVFQRPTRESPNKGMNTAQRRRDFELAVEWLCCDNDDLRGVLIVGLRRDVDRHGRSVDDLRRDVNELASNMRADYNDVSHLVRQIAAANAKIDKLGRLCEGFMTALAVRGDIVETPDGKRYVQVRKPYSTEYELKELPR